MIYLVYSSISCGIRIILYWHPVKLNTCGKPNDCCACDIYVQVKSEKWNGMFVDLLPGNPVDSGTIIKAQIEQPPEPMVFKVLCVRQHALMYLVMYSFYTPIILINVCFYSVFVGNKYTC